MRLMGKSTAHWHVHFRKPSARRGICAASAARMKRLTLLFAIALAPALRAELKLPAIFGDQMVLQQKQTNPVWGWDTPGTKVTVTFGEQNKSAEAGSDGAWRVKLDPVNANATPRTIASGALVAGKGSAFQAPHGKHREARSRSAVAQGEGRF